MVVLVVLPLGEYMSHHHLTFVLKLELRVEGEVVILGQMALDHHPLPQGGPNVRSSPLPPANTVPQATPQFYRATDPLGSLFGPS